MVTVKPYLRKIIELMVGGDFIRRQMTMIVVDRHDFGVLVVKSPCGLGLQEKIFAQKPGSHFTVLNLTLITAE
jgi:hypothetical protein